MAPWVRLIGAAAAAPWVAAPAAPAGGAAQTVAIENLQFSPQQITVRSGTRITWINKDLFPHTATADGHAFDSQSIAPAASWTWVAGKPGTYSYGCTFHPTMKATVTVR